MGSTVYLYPKVGKHFDANELRRSFLERQYVAADPTVDDGIVIASNSDELEQAVSQLAEYPDKPVWTVLASFSSTEIVLELDAPRNILNAFQPIYEELLSDQIDRAEDDESRIIEPATGSSLIETLLN